MLVRRAGSLRASIVGALPRREEAPATEPSPEVRRLARSAGTALAAIALLLAFTVGAQGGVYGPSAEGAGALAWVFALFVGAAVIGLFLLVLFLVRSPAEHRSGAPPTGARQRS
jgi:hypothetical protein